MRIILKISAAIIIGIIIAYVNIFAAVADDDLRQTFISAIPAFPGNIILGRPTECSITVSVMMNSDSKIFVEYSLDAIRWSKTAAVEFRAGDVVHMLIDNLAMDSKYLYRIIDANTENQIFPKGGFYAFHTAKPPGVPFIFTVQADSHLDGECLPELYKLSLVNALALQPDFHVDLGDTFMTGKIPKREDALKQYKAQRYYLGFIGHSVPIFLVLGNHDGEEASKKGACEADGLAVWSCENRKKYFPNPTADKFYSGNTGKQPYAGKLQNYYSWTWGDALFIVLDPYWYSRTTQGGRSPWNMTIGKIQYEWLADTLRQSRAKFKFVFIHQLVGGLDQGGRGGSEAASLYEWGGLDKDGKSSFAENRQGWEKTIHKLLVETGVNIVFHGHDHFFARQELDGIIYQLVPQPSHRNFLTHHAEEYGYKEGVFLPNSGCIKVCVSPERVNVEYIRSAVPEMERKLTNGKIEYSYIINANDVPRKK